MPKKRNRTDLQEYVPAGNGDASGEYANESGSNTHFSSFKEPSKGFESFGKENKLEAKAEPIGASLEGDNTKQYKDIDDYLSQNTFPPKKAQAIKDAFNYGTPETRAFVEKQVSKIGVKYDLDGKKHKGNTAFFRVNDNTINSGPNALTKNDVGTKGQTFYHETGHAIDYFYGEKKNIRAGVKHRNEKGEMVEYPPEWRSQPISYTYLTDGKNNIGGLMQLDMEGMYGKLKEDYENEKKSLSWDAQEKEILKPLNGLMSGRDKAELYSDLMYTSKDNLMAKIEPYKGTKLYDAIIKVHNDMEKVKEQRHNLSVKWGDVSDMHEAIFYTDICGVGHGSSYWGKSASNRSTEFFAEYLSAKATNPESYELIKKYFPRASEGMEKLLKIIGEK